MFCPEREQRYSLEEVIRAACAQIQNEASNIDTPNTSTIGNVEKLARKWVNIAALWYPYDFHGNSCTMEDTNGTCENWLHRKVCNQY